MLKDDLTGQKFGRLTAIEFIPDNHKWLCKCDCGNYKEVVTSKLTSLHTKSCGCLKNKYKITVRRIFSIWRNMLARCYIDSKRKDADYYAQKGIRVCEEWKTYESFEKWALENGYDENLTIDRIDENGDYEPNNCQWITIAEQQRKKKCNRWLSYKGTNKILSDWANELNIPLKTLADRIDKLGYSFEEAINKKPGLNKNSVILIYEGKEVNLTMLSKVCGISVSTVSKHIKQGDSVEQIVELANKINRTRKRG